MPLPTNLFTLKLTYTFYNCTLANDEINSLRNLKQKFVERICDQRITREVRQYSGFLPFNSRDSLVLRTLHDLLRNKQALSSLKYHIFTKIPFTDLLQSLSFSWLKWLVLNQFTATSCSQRIRLEIPTSCSVLFLLFKLDPVTKEGKTKSKLGI